MNDNIVKIKERVQIAVEVGESPFREFKSALEGTDGGKKPRATRDICKDVAEALVAFANADGEKSLLELKMILLLQACPTRLKILKSYWKAIKLIYIQAPSIKLSSS